MIESKPRLLVLASTYPRWPGDPEPGFVHELSKRLTREFDVHVICPHALDARSSEFMDEVRIHRFRYAPAALETLVQGGGIVSNLQHHPWKWLLVPLFLLGLAWQSARLIARLKPDCLHVHWIVPQGLALLLSSLFVRTLPPFLLTSHGGDLFGLRGVLASKLKRWVIRNADTMSVVSRPMVAPALALGATPARLTVIPMGVDFDERFCPDDRVVRNPEEILFVGRLVEKKGLKHLIAALPAILSIRPQAKLTIVGYGPEEAALRTRAAELGVGNSVVFSGAMPQSELPELYRRASVFVAPFVRAASGDQDGLPVALMEAIACGCPVVVGDLPAMDDLFNPDEADMRIDPNNHNALTERIIAALADQETARARANRLRDRLAERLNWTTISGQYAALLRGIMT